MISAIRYGESSFQIAYRLLEAGADYRIKNNYGDDIAFAALWWGGDPKSEQGQWREKVIRLLEKKGADLESARKRVAKKRLEYRSEGAWPNHARQSNEDHQPEDGTRFVPLDPPKKKR